MGRRGFTPEFKVEAVKLVTERGMSRSQAARDLGIHVNVLRSCIEDLKRDAKQAFPGRGKMRADDAEVARLKRELADVKAERDIQKSHSLLREGYAGLRDDPEDYTDGVHMRPAAARTVVPAIDRALANLRRP